MTEQTKTIKTFEEACATLGLSPTALPDVSLLPEKHQRAITAHYKLVIIAEALNEGWQPDWSDWAQYKYFPWFEVEASKDKPAGFGFSSAYYGNWYTHSDVGSRLCFRTRELAKYAGMQFQDLYKDYFLIS